MTEATARAILRIMAVATVLVGAILATTTVAGLVGVSSSMRSAARGLQVQATGWVAEVGFWAVLAYLLVAAWGLVLWRYSPGLARRIVE